MLVANVKKESNIVEYVIYMYQIEDLIRSFNFNLDKIDREIVQKYEQTLKVKEQIKIWYSDLIKKMKEEGIQEKGHLKELDEIVEGLEVLHQSLLNTFQLEEYKDLYGKAQSSIEELRSKSDVKIRPSEIALSINGLYGLLVLRLKKQPITDETQLALNKISAMMGNLAFQYNQMKMGKLRFPEAQKN